MEFLRLEDAPSQRYTFAIGDASFDCQFMYNQLVDRWSFTIWPEGETCPLRAGRFITPGTDLLSGLRLEQMLIALDRPGLSSSGINWYDRLTKELDDGLTPTFLVLGTVAEFKELIADQATAIC